MFNLHFDNVRENEGWLDKAVECTVRPGSRVDGAPFYTRDELKDLVSMRNRFLELLNRDQLIKVTKCINSLLEVEVLFDGFCKSLRQAQDKGKVLDDVSVDFLKKRADRIKKVIKILPQKIKSIDELPDDFAGRLPPDVLVPLPKPPKREDVVDPTGK